jgi:RNA polymerase sigma factor FliA
MESAVAEIENKESSALEKSLEQRNDIILEYMPLVKFVAHRIASRLPKFIEISDLINAGVIGLIDAIEKFDPNREIKFKTYAETRIRGAILDDLRSMDPISRSQRSAQRTIKKTTAEIEQTNLRIATTCELAEKLEVSEDELEKMRCDAEMCVLNILDEAVSDDKNSNLLVENIPDTAISPTDLAIINQHKKLLIETINQLSQQDNISIVLYNFGDMPMSQIGRIMGISEARVSQIYSQAINRLVKKLTEKLGKDYIGDPADIVQNTKNNIAVEFDEKGGTLEL